MKVSKIFFILSIICVNNQNLFAQDYNKNVNKVISQRKHEVELISLISDKNEKNVIPPKLTISSDSLLTLIKYPEIAKFAGVDGIVEIKFIVNKNGEVENISKIIGIGAGCDENTILTFEKLIFEPALKQNKPVDIEMIAKVNFKINNK